MGKEEIKKYRKDRERMRWERKIKIGDDWDKRKEKKRKKKVEEREKEKKKEEKRDGGGEGGHARRLE